MSVTGFCGLVNNMRYKLTQPKRTSEFLFSPRYCGDCGTAFWLERVPLKKGEPSCSVCGADYIYLNKSIALEKYIDPACFKE